MKHVGLSIILAICAIDLYAQKITFDAYAGMITSTLRGDEDKLLSSGRFDRRYAFQGGLLISVPVNDFLKFKTGIQYSQRGAAIQASSFFYSVVYVATTVKIDCVEVPLLFALGRENVHVFAGPQISFVSRSDVKGLQSPEYGIKYGLGFDFSRIVSAQILFYHGLTNMTGSSEAKMYNRYMGLVIGARIFSVNVAERDKETSTRKRKKKKEFEVPHRTID